MTERGFLKFNFISNFIDLYRSEPCLWKVKSKEYTDRTKKASAYEKLVQLLKQVEPNANRATVTKKINNLRCSYRKELRKLVQSKKTATCEADVYVPKLWYFDQFSFLLDQESESDPNQDQYKDQYQDVDLEVNSEDQYEEIKLETNSIDFEENNLQSEDESWCKFSTVTPVTTSSTSKIETKDILFTFPTSPPITNVSGSDGEAKDNPTSFSKITPVTNISVSKEHTRRSPSSFINSNFQVKRKKSYTKSTQEIIAIDPLQQGHLQNFKQDDHFDIYGKYVANKLRGLHGSQKTFAEKLINDVLFEAEMGTLARNFKIAKC